MHMRKVTVSKYYYAFLNIPKESNGEIAFVILSKHALLGVFYFQHGEMCSSLHCNNTTLCELHVVTKA